MKRKMKGRRVDEGHLSNINPKILLVVRPVADRQPQLLLLAGLVKLHLLKEQGEKEGLVV